MQVGVVRIIDRFAGVVLCLILSIWHGLTRLWGGGQVPAEPVRNILFIKLSEQGATVLACPAIQRAISLVGREGVYFCVFEENREILDILGLLPPENILTVRNDGFLVFVRDLLCVLRRMRAIGIDTSIDMELFARITPLLAYLSGAKRRVGLHRFTTEGLYRGNLLTHRVIYNPYLHMSVHCDVLVQAAERDPSEVPLAKAKPALLMPELPAFQPEPEERARIMGLLSEDGEIPHPLVVFNPKVGDVLPIRKWSAERYAGLGRRLLEQYPTARIAIIGLPFEKEAVDALCAAIDPERAINLAGALGLRDVLTLFTVADVLVSSDSGPAHFAGLTPIHIVALFGPETPVLYGPMGPRVQVVHAGLACSPCVSASNHRHSPCSVPGCMEAISVEAVYDAVAAALRQQMEREASGRAPNG